MIRADAEKTMGEARAEAARERDELRADLRVRAERAEQQADAYRDELAQLRAASRAAGTGTVRSLPRPRGAQPHPGHLTQAAAAASNREEGAGT